MSLPNAMEELRKREQVLDHQKRLLKDMEQDQQQLWKALQEAEFALDQGVKDKELIINHMKAVEAALNEAREQAMASRAAAAAPLPSLRLETLPEEATAGRPEAASFQHVLRNFVTLYSLASSKVDALSGRDSLQFQFQPITAVQALTPSEDQSWGEPRKTMDTSFGSDSGSSMPSSISYPSSGSDSGYFSMSPNRTYTVSGSDLSTDSFRRPQGPISPRGPIPAGDALCAPPARAPARAPLPSPPPPAGPSAFLFQPQGASTPRGPPPDGKSAFQEIILTWIWVQRQHPPSCCTASVGKHNSALVEWLWSNTSSANRHLQRQFSDNKGVV
ncbi:uncharacterized protein LOC135290408 isoform X1 [Passer domesticus]|uniref:uncharacterized protein LOC135290408 isoform X1 n=1 Tax=Passer domesticus TaxID=48849 RepID=UPI0030FE5F3D